MRTNPATVSMFAALAVASVLGATASCGSSDPPSVFPPDAETPTTSSGGPGPDSGPPIVPGEEGPRNDFAAPILDVGVPGTAPAAFGGANVEEAGTGTGQHRYRQRHFH